MSKRKQIYQRYGALVIEAPEEEPDVFMLGENPTNRYGDPSDLVTVRRDDLAFILTQLAYRGDQYHSVDRLLAAVMGA